jgi:hypothetical protein
MAKEPRGGQKRLRVYEQWQGNEVSCDWTHMCCADLRCSSHRLQIRCCCCFGAMRDRLQSDSESSAGAVCNQQQHALPR